MRTRTAIKTGAVVMITLASISAIILLALPACDGLPGKACRADQVNVFGVSPDSGPNTNCTSCLQRQCCDKVGFCSESASCTEQFRDAQACVIVGGPREEARCKSNLVEDAGKELYQCMRGMKDECHHACGVPSCTLDTSVILFGTARCDRCVGSACCDEVNTCYQDRGCKLTLECIIEKCAATLADGMNLLHAQGRLDELSKAVCGGRIDPSGGPTPEGDCVGKCLQDFAPFDGGTADDQLSQCRAFGVYACAAKANCGNECIAPDAAAPTNNKPKDASADADADAN